jgi:hypothetical protein
VGELQTSSRWDRIRARNTNTNALVIGNQNDQNGDNKEKEFEMEKTAYMALLAIQRSEDRVPHENYDPSEAVSPSSENENEETAQELDEKVEVCLDEEMQD